MKKRRLSAEPWWRPIPLSWRNQCIHLLYVMRSDCPCTYRLHSLDLFLWNILFPQAPPDLFSRHSTACFFFSHPRTLDVLSFLSIPFLHHPKKKSALLSSFLVGSGLALHLSREEAQGRVQWRRLIHRFRHTSTPHKVGKDAEEEEEESVLVAANLSYVPQFWFNQPLC